MAPTGPGLQAFSGAHPPLRRYCGLTQHRRPQPPARQIVVAEGYCYSLSLLGVLVAITPHTTATLAELNYGRNCFLHRGGIVDERAAREAPLLNVLLGAKIRISEEKSKEYLKAVSDFTEGLLKGAIESRYSPVAGP